MREILHLRSEDQEVVSMWTGKSRLVVGLVVVCFWASTIQAGEQGEIYGWGSQKLPNDPLADVSKIAAGGGHSLALKSDGSIIGWGLDAWFAQATPPVGNDFVAIAAGGSHSLALKSDGSIVEWGYDGYGLGSPPEGTVFIAIAAGYFHSLALRSDGSIVGWGNDYYGQASPPGGKGFIAIAAGGGHSLALKSDGSIVGWGRNDDGQATPPAGNDFVAIAAGEVHSLALKSDGSIVGWGSDYYGLSSPPVGNDFVAITAGEEHSLALKSDGSIVGWGWDGYGQASPPSGNDFVAIAAGGYHSLAMKSDGSVVGWGWNEFGQAMGSGDNDYVAIAAGEEHSLGLKSDGSIVGWGSNYVDGYIYCGQATPPSGNDFVAIAAGYYHSLALKSDGSIVGWGGMGRDNYIFATESVGDGFVAIAAGGYHSLALKSDGSIVEWGNDYWGQATPPMGNDFIAIAAGYQHSLAMKSDGSIVGWGWDEFGQATAPLGKGFVAIAAGGDHSLALKSDGSIVGWGNDEYGQASPPVGNDFIAITAGGSHSLALKSDGSIVGWGWDDNGQATVPTGTDFIAIAAGGTHSLAIKYVFPVDINNDHRVDLSDFGIVSAGWMESKCDEYNDFCSGADIDHTGDVGLGDLLILAENWLEGVPFPTPAFGPYPTDGMSGVNPNTELSWSAGVGAVSHNIYFGTSSPGVFQRNQTGAMFDPGPLDFQTTYYWRTDEVQADSSVVKGDVWRFTTGYLVGHWELDELSGMVAADSVGDNDGTLNGDPTWWPSGGKIGGALEFDGVGDYVEVEGYKSISGSNPRTVSAWVKVESTGSTFSIVRWGTLEINGGLWSNVINADGKLRVAVWGGSVVGDTDIDDGTWHHVAIVLPDKANVKVEDIRLYVDGEREYTTISSGSQTINTAVGMDVLISLDGSVGMLDDVRIYNYAMSTGEIRTLAGFPPELVAHWELDESSGTVASDSVGGNDGTLMGDPTWWPSGGMLGGTLEFDGDGDYVEVEGYKGISGSNPRSVTAWVRAESNGSILSIVCWGTTEISGGLWSNVVNADGNLRVAVWGGSVVGDTDIDDDTWHHVAIVLPDKWNVKVEDIRLYVDGEPESITIDHGSQTIDTAVGMDVFIAHESSDGFLDDVRIYNYALSEEEIGLSMGVLSAFGPDPADGMSGVNPDTELSWSAGGCAVSHNIYFGTNSPGEFQCNQVSSTFDPGPLDCGTTYYWRIDEVQGDSSVIEGDVWRFTTVPPGSAFGPDPVDGAADVNTRMELSWSAGDCAVSHNIYFGTTSPGVFQGNQTGATFDPGALELETMYYWRIDEVQADSSVVEGDVWRFTTRSDMLVGWWELDESEGGTAYDSANGHNGTLNGDPVWWPSDGKIGGALEFDGVGDYVEVAGYKGISGSNPRTVSAWVKVESTGSTFSIVRWGTTAISGGLWSNVVNADGKLRAAVIGGSVVGDTDIDDGTWHHVAIVLPDKEDVKVEDILLYVDGGQEDVIISLGTQTIDTAVGMDVLISLDGSVGMLDDVRIYNYALSEEEIGALAGVL